MLSLTCVEKNGIELIISHMGCVQFPFDSLAKICSINLATPILEQEVVDYFRKNFIQNEANYKRYVNTIELIPSVTEKEVFWKGFGQWMLEPEHLNGYIVEVLNNFHASKTVKHFNPILYNQATELGWRKFLYELVSFDGEEIEKKEPGTKSIPVHPNSILVRSQSISDNKSIEGTIYLISNRENNTLKIGFSKNSVRTRLAAFQVSCAHRLEILKTKKGTLTDEKELLERFKEFNLRREWFTWDDSIIAAFD